MSINIKFGNIDENTIDFICKIISIENCYHNPKYALTLADADNGIAKFFLIYDIEKKYFCYYQFIVRKIDCEIDGIMYYDIISPFDYGEIYNNNEELLKLFLIEFDKYCSNSNIVSEFIRFNPFSMNNLDVLKKHYEIIYGQKHFYINLNKDFYNDFSRGKKSDIKKGLKDNFIFCEDSIDNFYPIYVETMKRINASDYFLFDKKILSNLKNDNLLQVFSIKHNLNTVMSILVLKGNDICYYFLSGTKDQYFKYRLNSKLLFYIANYYKDKNYSKFFLGGGQGSLYKFKSELSKSTVQYYMGKKIYNIEIYDKLVERLNMFSNDFFPKYRKKVI